MVITVQKNDNKVNIKLAYDKPGPKDTQSSSLLLSPHASIDLGVRNPKYIKAELDSNLGESTPLFKYWVAEFKRGRMSFQDEHRSGDPNDDSKNGEENPQSITG
ncbi:hypothetical protein TNCV_1963671 [Trichonephila clavipes]|nr:hypothetical protein TNCV_1963671 [Trichonephila clavipes]